MISFETRNENLEILDLEELADRDAAETYRLIEYVNRYLGGTRVVLTHLENFSSSWPKDRPIQILDVGCGSADIPRSIASWAKENGFLVSITALDSSRPALRYAKEKSLLYPEISWIQANATRLPFQRHSFLRCLQRRV